MISDGDVVLALSYSGETEELLRLLPAIKRFDVAVVSMTRDRKSSLGKHSDLVLPVRVEKEACPFNLTPTSSMAVMLAVSDAVAMALMERKGVSRHDWGMRHHGGYLGRAARTDNM